MRIAIVRLSALGDIIQSMIVVQFIRSNYPQSTIDWVVDKKFSEIVRLNKLVDNIIEVRLNEIKKSKNILHLIKHLSGLRKIPKYDFVIDTQGLLKSAIISKLIPSIKTIGFDRKSTREFLASFLYSKSYSIPYELNVVERYCRLISKALDIHITKEDIFNKEDIFHIPKNITHNSQIISIVVGASFDSKVYPVENYHSIIEQINAKFICLWGNHDELKFAKKLSDFNSRVVVSKKTTFIDLLKIIASSSLVIGGDTGPTHLAWALNIPSITLFGPTLGNRNMFQTDINLKLESDSFVDIRKIKKNDYSISNINPQKVIALSHKLLEKTKIKS